MYSVKPGRGPSLMGAISGVAAAVFGVIWTIGATSAGAPGFFALFGVVFVLMALGGVAYNLHNATQKNRMSTFDITTGQEESDPIAKALGHEPDPAKPSSSTGTSGRQIPGEYCPYCGARVASDYSYCPQCGKDI